MLSYFQVEAPIHRPSFYLFFSLTIKDKTKISLTIKILLLGQGSFTRKVRTIFTLKVTCHISLSVQVSVVKCHISLSVQVSVVKYHISLSVQDTVQKGTYRDQSL
jgi:hypothetical protein